MVVDLVFKLLPLRQPLLTRHTTEVLASLASSPRAHLAPATLSEIMNVSLSPLRPPPSAAAALVKDPPARAALTGAEGGARGCSGRGVHVCVRVGAFLRRW